MNNWVQSMESRVLFAATAAGLAADLATIKADAAAIKVDNTNLNAVSKADRKAIATDLKAAPKTASKTNAPLLRTFNTDDGLILQRLQNNLMAMLLVQLDATAGVSNADKVIAKPTNIAAQSTVAGDIFALNNAPTHPLSRLPVVESETSQITTDLAALTAANPTLTQLATDAAKTPTDLSPIFTQLNADANAYVAALAALATDLMPYEPPPTTSPSLVGDYNGYITTNGVNVLGSTVGQQTFAFELNIASQTLTTLSGTITADGNSASGTIAVTELVTGHVVMKVVNSSATIILQGSLNLKPTKHGLPPGAVITGTGDLNFNGNDIAGSFAVSKTS